MSANLLLSSQHRKAHTTGRYISMSYVYMCVCKNSGTPKWMIFNGKPYWTLDDLGVPLFSETSIWIMWMNSLLHHLRPTIKVCQRLCLGHQHRSRKWRHVTPNPLHLAVALGPLVAGILSTKCSPSTGHMFSQSSQPPKKPKLPPSSLFPKKKLARIIFQDIQQKHQKSQVNSCSSINHQPNSSTIKVSSLTYQPKLVFWSHQNLDIFNSQGIGVGVAAMPEWAEGGGFTWDWLGCEWFFFLEPFLLLYLMCLPLMG